MLRYTGSYAYAQRFDKNKNKYGQFSGTGRAVVVLRHNDGLYVRPGITAITDASDEANTSAHNRRHVRADADTRIRSYHRRQQRLFDDCHVWRFPIGANA